MTFTRVKKISKAVKTFIKNRYQYIYVTLYIWIFVVPSLSKNSCNNSYEKTLSPIHKYVNNNLFEINPNQELYDVIKGNIKNIDCDEKLMCKTPSTSGNVPSGSVAPGNSSASSSAVEAFTPKAKNSKSSGYNPQPKKTFPFTINDNVDLNRVHGGPSSITVSFQQDSSPDPGGDSGDPSGSGDESCFDLENSKQDKSDKLALNNEYDPRGQMVSKKPASEETVELKDQIQGSHEDEKKLDIIIPEQDQNLFDNDEDLISDTKNKRRKTTRPRPGRSSKKSKQDFSSLSTKSTNKNQILKVQNEEENFVSIMEYAKTECQEYIDYVDKHLVHESFDEQVDLSRLDKLSINEQFNPNKSIKNVEKRSRKSIEEAHSILHAEKIGLIEGKVERVNNQLLREGKITTDFVARHENESSKLQAIEQKAPLPILTKDISFEAMGERLAKRGVDQCERARENNPDVTSGVVIIDHKYLTEHASQEIHKGVEHVINQNKNNTNILIHEINFKRP